MDANTTLIILVVILAILALGWALLFRKKGRARFQVGPVQMEIEGENQPSNPQPDAPSDGPSPPHSSQPDSQSGGASPSPPAPQPDAASGDPTPAPQPDAPSGVSADDFAYDVFISYSHRDEAWVRGELLSTLEKAGLRVCIDFRDFRPGAPGVTEMERAVQESRRTLLVLTPAYLNSAWTEFEALMLQTLDPANRQRRLIPLLREKCQLPTRIRYLTYVNFVDPESWEIAWRQLLVALGAPPRPQPDAPSRGPTPAAWRLVHPYPMPPNFTGREQERALLSNWLNQDAGHPLLILRALGGFGKSALAWRWLTHDVDAGQWPRVLWWSFYDEREFSAFLAETLTYLGVDIRRYPNPRQQVDILLRLMHKPGVLLILDGFERALRAYNTMMAPYLGDEEDEAEEEDAARQRDCISPMAEAFLRGLATLPGIQSKALMTTRLTPRILQTRGGDLLQGCREEEVTALDKADAVAYFRLRGVRGSRAEIEAACARYGYHPLSLALLAGLVLKDLQTPGDIRAARRLDITGSLIQRQHHVLQAAYDNLTPARRRLLSHIACFRGPVAYEALRALAEEGQDIDADLIDLIDRGLLHHDTTTNRYDLHPIVRRYAYDRLTGDERTAAHTQLRDYFQQLADAEIPEELRDVPAELRALFGQKPKVQTLEDLAPVIELYHHTVRAGLYDEACDLFYDRINKATYYQFGAYQLRIELLRALFPDGEDQPLRLKDESDQAWTLNALANSYSLSGQPRRAIPLFEQAIVIGEKRGDKKNLAIRLGNLADDQMKTGALRAAEANLRRSIELDREIEEAFREAIGHQEMGRLLAYRGRWAEAGEELAVALEIFEKEAKVQSQGIVWAYRALRALLMMRQSPSPDIAAGALAAARRALELADEDARTDYPVERDYVRAHWLLGAAHRVNGHLDEAEQHLTEALRRCRGINLVEFEADILLDLARLRRDQGQGEEGVRLAQEALLITERSGYALQGADVHLFLAEMALAAGDRDSARDRARQARALAACDGPPDYAYKVAYDEAGALLARLG